MKSIDTLVEDIYSAVSDGVVAAKEDIDALGSTIAAVVADRLSPEHRLQKPRLRLSILGGKCDRQLWLRVNRPEVIEPLSPETKLKFLIGDIHEAVLLFLAKVSGHTVEGQQDTVELAGIEGHIDGRVDGVLVDVKSATPMSFDKFEEGLTSEKDSFGYIAQINSYMQATDAKEGAFLASDKTVGRITLDLHKRNNVDYSIIAEDKKAVLAQSKMPNRGYLPEPMGKAGNLKLPTPCVYCDVKTTCYPQVRKFMYANGPVYLTFVAELPKVPEATS